MEISIPFQMYTPRFSVCVFVLSVSFFVLYGRSPVRPYTEISIRLCHRSRLLNKFDGNFTSFQMYTVFLCVLSCLSFFVLHGRDEVRPSAVHIEIRLCHRSLLLISVGAPAGHNSFRCITPQGFCVCLSCLSVFFSSCTDGRSPSVRTLDFHQIVPSVTFN
jgi:hypothetical protein